MKKLGETLKSNMYGIIGMLVIAGASWFGGTFKRGHDANEHDKVIFVMKSTDGVALFDSLFDSRSNEKTTDFEMFDKILNSPFIGDYVRETSRQLEKKIVSDYQKRDSTRIDMIHALGEGTGIRNEDVMKELTKLLKAFKEGRLYSSRTVHATF